VSLSDLWLLRADYKFSLILTYLLNFPTAWLTSSHETMLYELSLA